MEEQVKLAVLEQKIEDLKPVILKIDDAIEKLSEVNTTVSRMLAVHEERISKQQEVDDILFAKIDKLRDKMDSDNDSVLQRLRQLEKRVWISLGAMAIISFAMNTSTIISKLLTVQAAPTTIERSYTN
jgi:chromosome segregation ATPase